MVAVVVVDMLAVLSALVDQEGRAGITEQRTQEMVDTGERNARREVTAERCTRPT